MARAVLLTMILWPLLGNAAMAQDADSVWIFHGVVYNRSFEPVTGTHVINLTASVGATSSALGLFSIAVRTTDTLLFSNIAYRELRIPVSSIMRNKYVVLDEASYSLKEATIFEWGSSYEDFKKAVTNLPNQETLGEELGWPRADPDKIPYQMDEAYLKSLGFAIKSPISYLYHKHNKKAKSERKLYWADKNRAKQERYDDIVSGENIAGITGLQGEELLAFLSYLSQRMVCGIKCTEFEIYNEIYAHWQAYQQINPSEKE